MDTYFALVETSTNIGIGNQIASQCNVHYRILPSPSSLELGSGNGKTVIHARQNSKNSNHQPSEEILIYILTSGFLLMIIDKAPSTVWSLLTQPYYCGDPSALGCPKHRYMLYLLKKPCARWLVGSGIGVAV